MGGRGPAAVATAPEDTLASHGKDAVMDLVRRFAYLALLPCVVALVATGCGSDEDDPAAQQENIDTLIRQLGSEDEGLRWDAAWELRGMGEAAADAVPALIQALMDESERVRWAAASGLGAIGPVAKDAAPALIAALADESESVRATARIALRGIGEPAVPDVIRALSEGTDGVQSQAASVLTDIATPEALTAVEEWKAAQEEPTEEPTEPVA